MSPSPKPLTLVHVVFSSRIAGGELRLPQPEFARRHIDQHRALILQYEILLLHPQPQRLGRLRIHLHRVERDLRGGIAWRAQRN